MKVLVTGAAGYIGSHTCVELLMAGHEVVALDNFSNSHPEALARVAELARRAPTVIEADVRDRDTLVRVLERHGCTAVIHFAGLKAVGESVAQPLAYYDNNVLGTLRLLEAMQACGVKTLVFSSSATVYGEPQRLPLTEDHPLSATNPYGRTKLVVEEMLRDLFRAQPDWRIALLRYFNPVGAHPSGRIGEDPGGVPNNLMPYVAQVAVGRLPKLRVFGNDYPTPRVTSMNGLTIDAHEDLSQLAQADAVLVGSGMKTREVANTPALMEQLRALNPERQLLAAQCSGTFLLSRLGLLRGTPACTDLTSKPWVVESGVDVVPRAFTARGNVATAGGSLASQYLVAWLLARLKGLDAAREVLHYFAPVGEKQEYIDRALAHVLPVLEPQAVAV